MNTHTQRDYEQRILRVLVHIQGHLDDVLDLEGLAGVACFSPYHFHRIFRGVVGESVKEYVRRLRIERAAHRLKTCSATITQVALEAGYETHAAFSRAFRERFGESPSQFRVQAQNHEKALHPNGPACLGLSNGPVSSGRGAALPVRYVDRPDVRVAFVRHVGPYGKVDQAWRRLSEWAEARGLLRGRTEYIGLSWDDPEVTRPEKLRYDACISIGPQVQPEGDIGVQTIAGGPHAVATHRGPFESISDIYTTMLGEILPASNRRPGSAPCFEVYSRLPTDSARDIVADLCVPLEC